MGPSMDATFTYDGDGKRVKSVIGNETTYFVGNYYEVTGSTVTKYYYAGASRIAMRKDGTLNYILSDHLGSTSLVTDASGAVVSELRYTAWGEVRYESGTTPTEYTYTGQYSNMVDFGLMFYNARWYDPCIIQWTQADTLIPNPYNVLDWNRFAYARYNPLKYTDPSGHIAENFDNDSNCEPYDNCYEVNPFTRDGSTLRGDEYRDWLVEATNWLVWTDGDSDLLEGLLGELKPFVMKDPNFKDDLIGTAIDPDFIYGFSAGIAGLFGIRGSVELPDKGFVGGPGSQDLRFGSYKSSTKWKNQMAKRGWTMEQIYEAVQVGESIPVRNAVNKGNSATLYYHPITGRAVVIDNITMEIIHIGGDNFNYSNWILR